MILGIVFFSASLMVFFSYIILYKAYQHGKLQALYYERYSQNTVINIHELIADLEPVDIK